MAAVTDPAAAQLRRSLVRDTIGDDLYNALNAVLDEYSRPTPDQIGQTTQRLRDVTAPLVQAIPYLVTPYPAAEIRHLLDLRSERPEPEHAYRHAVRFALTIVDLLGLMGEGAP
ncbi:DUF6415 family natural product biosynthesis protein [Streptomyces sp. x-80]|uniref:DUF6415 family natural product biosynthesis protein n=1 Tax=Streptomyces sp. x-80 TaxID=2789282 RepID=UPI0039806EBA